MAQKTKLKSDQKAFKRLIHVISLKEAGERLLAYKPTENDKLLPRLYFELTPKRNKNNSITEFRLIPKLRDETWLKPNK
jgi:hypothetical protein